MSTWAEIFKKADPYELSGLLKSEWRNVVYVMTVDSEAITLIRLLENYKATIAGDLALAKNAVIAKDIALAKEAVNPTIIKKKYQSYHSY